MRELPTETASPHKSSWMLELCNVIYILYIYINLCFFCTAMCCPIIVHMFENNVSASAAPHHRREVPRLNLGQ